MAGSSPRRTSGWRSRSGSSWIRWRAEPFGQMKPRLNGLSRSPRTRTTLPSRTVELEATARFAQRAGAVVGLVGRRRVLDGGHPCPSFPGGWALAGRGGSILARSSPAGSLRGMAASQVAYPDRWETDVALADGGTVHIRPAHARRLGISSRRSTVASRGESIYFRYFSPMPKLSAREIDRLTNVDELTHMAFVALLGDDIIGVASYDVSPGRNEAETAFIVDDAHHGRGIATLLLEYLAVAAREHGLGRVDRAGLAQQPAHGVGVPSSRFRGGERVRRRTDRGPARSRAHAAERGQDRGTRTSIRGTLGGAACSSRRRSPSSAPGSDPDGLGNRVSSATFRPRISTARCTRSTRKVSPSTAWPASRRWPTPGRHRPGARGRVPATARPRRGRGVRSQARARVGGHHRRARRRTRRWAALERRVVDRALRFGMRVIGPESLGVINTAADSPMFATFATSRSARPSRPGTGRVPHAIGHARHRRAWNTRAAPGWASRPSSTSGAAPM